MDTQELRLAVVQMTSKATVRGNVDEAEQLIRKAFETPNGVDLICFPECANLLQQDPRKSLAEIFSEADDPFLAWARRHAKTHGVWIHTGSLALKVPGEAKLVNRSFIIDNTGEIAARYDKIHLFDAAPDEKNIYRESDRYMPGKKAVLADTPWGKWGLSICYDVRFPHLYRAYARAGASVLFVPAAFTVPTGQAHWHALLRSRAIENGCFVVAPAQCGRHEDGRATFGHSLVVNPWGEIVAEAGTAPCLLTVRLNLSRVAGTRLKIPSLLNERPFETSF